MVNTLLGVNPRVPRKKSKCAFSSGVVLGGSGCMRGMKVVFLKSGCGFYGMLARVSSLIKTMAPCQPARVSFEYPTCQPDARAVAKRRLKSCQNWVFNLH